MLSYQHGYHAGNLADVHKHALLAAVLGLMTAKDKPLSYVETHAGRGLYDLGDAMALRTGEAEMGIGRCLERGLLAGQDRYLAVIGATRAAHGDRAYPGSPLIAAGLLRPGDSLRLAELHPQEHQALLAVLGGDRRVTIVLQDGMSMAMSVTPPMPRRGLMVIDPSYELKEDYAAMPALLAALHRRWNVGVLMLWYPVLASGAQRGMQARLAALDMPRVLHHQVEFAPARPGHGMIGSGVYIVNAPFGLSDGVVSIDAAFAALRG